MQPYRAGREDQLGALGLVLNAVVLWNSRYIDLAVNVLRGQGYPCATRTPPACRRWGMRTSTSTATTRSSCPISGVPGGSYAIPTTPTPKENG
jgi:hypothetical protein